MDGAHARGSEAAPAMREAQAAQEEVGGREWWRNSEEQSGEEEQAGDVDAEACLLQDLPKGEGLREFMYFGEQDLPSTAGVCVQRVGGSA